MKILVVGGAGLIGGHAALRLAQSGHDVVIAGRNAPAEDTPLGKLPFQRLDFVNDDPPADLLSRFDALVFSASNDIRHVPKGADYFQHVTQANTVAQPRFFAAARDAGVRTAINIGSFYPHVAPHLLDSNPYVRSRYEAWLKTRALACPDFKVVSIDAPSVVGTVPGQISMFAAFVRYVEGRLLDAPVVAPAGGVTWVSTDTMSDCVEALLERGETGRGYLIGDESLTHQQIFGAFCEAVGKPVPPVSQDEHPILPDISLAWGRGNSLYFNANPQDAAMLNYRRGDVLRTIREEIVPQYAGASFPIRLDVF